MSQLSDSAGAVFDAASADRDGGTTQQQKVCVVGSGWRFTSGISYYTCELANALAGRYEVSVIQMRRLLPRRLYPGWRRVGDPRARATYRPDVRVYDGVDWWWGRSLVGAAAFLRSNRPDVLALQWWTATVLHTYLFLAIMARVRGSRVVVELHEVQDTGEGRFAPVRWYGRWGLQLLLRLSEGCVTHSNVDRRALQSGYKLPNTRVTVVPHGPFSQYHPNGVSTLGQREGDSAITAVRAAPQSAFNLLYFGTIRPYKGLENLLTAFNSLDRAEASALWLTVVGETWEGCVEPARLIATSPHKDRITFVNDYVPDEVVGAAFGHADAVVLPYLRSSSSGPLHVAMSWGLPVIVTRVGGLPEAAAGYAGALFVPPNDQPALTAALRQVSAVTTERFPDPRSWNDSVDALIDAAGVVVIRSEDRR